MKKIILAVGLIAFIPSYALADSVGGCGWGSKVFHGQKGIAPQILAVTTNGTSGNQTFGITFGTWGCDANGVVRSEWKTAMFIDANKTKLAKDMAIGSGESLDSLANLLGVSAEDKARFASVSKSEFSRIFPNAEVTSNEVLVSLREVLAADSTLAKYSKNI